MKREPVVLLKHETNCTFLNEKELGVVHSSLYVLSFSLWMSYALYCAVKMASLQVKNIQTVLTWYLFDLMAPL